jgi:hypothetical protein
MVLITVALYLAIKKVDARAAFINIFTESSQAVLRNIAYSLSLSMMADQRAFPVEGPTPQQTSKVGKIMLFQQNKYLFLVLSQQYL